MLPLCLVQVDSLLTFLWCRLLCARRELRSSTGAPPPGPAGHSATAHHPELPAPGFAEAATFRGESARPDFPAKPHRPRGRVGPGTPRPAPRWRSPYPGTLRRARAPRPGARPNREHPRPGAPQTRSARDQEYLPTRSTPDQAHRESEVYPRKDCPKPRAPGDREYPPPRSTSDWKDPTTESEPQRGGSIPRRGASRTENTPRDRQQRPTGSTPDPQPPPASGCQTFFLSSCFLFFVCFFFFCFSTFSSCLLSLITLAAPLWFLVSESQGGRAVLFLTCFLNSCLCHRDRCEGGTAAPAPASARPSEGETRAATAIHPFPPPSAARRGEGQPSLGAGILKT